MYLNVFIYNMFSADAGAISLMVGASAVSAALTTVFIGALSDKIGKRKVFMCGGYILWGVSILGFTLLRVDILKAIFPFASAAVLGVAFTVALDVIMTFFGSSANDAAFNAWLTDSTSESSRGTAEGINAMMPLVAILAVFGGFMAFDLTLPRSWTIIFIIIGIVVILVGILGFFIIKEPKLEPAKEGYFKTVIYGFLPSTIKKSQSLYLYLGGFIIFNIAIQIFMPYLIIYYERSLGMENYVFIMAPAIIIASVATVLFGKLYDKRGFVLSSSISIGLLALGFLTLFIFKHTVPVFIGSLLMMSGYLAGMAVFGAKIRDLTPLGKSGMLQGVRIFSQVLVPGIVGPFIGKLVLSNAEQIENSDGTYSFLPNEYIFLAALVTTIILAIYLITLFVVKSKRKKEPQK
jgi:MFS family permease